MAHYMKLSTCDNLRDMKMEQAEFVSWLKQAGREWNNELDGKLKDHEYHWIHASIFEGTTMTLVFWLSGSTTHFYLHQLIK